MIADVSPSDTHFSFGSPSDTHFACFNGLDNLNLSRLDNIIFSDNHSSYNKDITAMPLT